MDNLVLGKATEYSQYYKPALLQGVPRALGRKEINLPSNLPFTGSDIWNAYEVSWLNTKGKPLVAILECKVPIESEFLIESKSFKLYLNSFNQSRFESPDQVLGILKQDLSTCAGAKVDLKLLLAKDFPKQEIKDLPYQSDNNYVLLDEIDIDIDAYEPQAETIVCGSNIVSETLVSHLLKSNCLITNQPDWGSVLIKYSGPQIHRDSILKYIISFRQHNEFHEQCVERIFYDIWRVCKPKKLTVYARYTRRGGLDINPFRSTFEKPYANIRLARQ